MRILLAGPFPPPYGGVQVNLTAIREYVLEHGGTCSVINLTRYRDTRAENLYHPAHAGQVIRLLFTLPYDIVHMHHGGDLTVRLMALYLVCGLMPFRKSVLTCHSGGLPTSHVGKTARYWSVFGFIFRRLDRIIVVNEAMADMFRRFGVPSDRIRFILPFSVRPPDPHRPLPPEMARFFANHSPRILGVGGLETEYDISLQIRALQQVLNHHPNAGLMVIGSGSLEATLREQIRMAPYADRILLCPGVERADTLCAIRDCDVFLRTTHYDGDAVSVREALFLGKPVVATDNGMRPPGVTCIPVGDADALARAIDQVLAAPQPTPQSDAGGDNLRAVWKLYEELLSHT